MLWPGWEGGQNLGCTEYLSDVGHIILVARETCGRAGHYKINSTRSLNKPVPDMTYNVFGGTLNLALSISQHTTHLPWPQGCLAHHPFTDTVAHTGDYTHWASVLTVGYHIRLYVHSHPKRKGKERSSRCSEKLGKLTWHKISSVLLPIYLEVIWQRLREFDNSDFLCTCLHSVSLTMQNETWIARCMFRTQKLQEKRIYRMRRKWQKRKSSWR